MDEPHERQHDLRLAALQVADEVAGEGVAVARVLGGQVLGAVLADRRMPASRKHAKPVDVDVLGRHEDLDVAGGRPAALAASATRLSHLGETLPHVVGAAS